MNENTQTPQDDTSPKELVACEVCLKEIPVSGAKSEETATYVTYFCGLECYEKWKRQSEQAPEE